jgi:type IV pilus assembly protein PilW
MKRLHSGARQRGMSIVELMVGMMIALIGVVVMFQVFAVNEGVRRSTTAGSDEQTSGLLSLLLLERELRVAGYGINDSTLLGCKMKMYDAMRTPNIQDFTLAPARVEKNTDDQPDKIHVIYGGVTRTAGASPIFEPMDSTTAPITLPWRYGFVPSDLIAVGEAGSCTVREVTSTPGSKDLAFGVGPYTNGYSNQSQSPRFNDPAGTPVAYGMAAMIANLGPNPVRNEITVQVGQANPADNHKLVVTNLLGQLASPNPVGEQIVHLKAEYGIDDGVSNGTVSRASYLPDDNVIDKFTVTEPTDAQGWSRVRAVRVALVSRSLTPEKPLSGTACDATADYSTATTYPVRWARGPDAPDGRPIDLRHPGNPDWRCYKYRVYETTIPLRNMLWRQP